MKNQIAGWVTACATLLLSSLAFGQAGSYTEVSFSGYDGPEYSYDSGIVDGPSSHDTGFLPGPSTVSGSTSANFGPGYLQVLALANDFVPSGYTAGLSGTAIASYTDTVIPVAGPIGTLITITASWTLHGSVASNYTLNGTGVAQNPYNGLPSYVEASADSELSIAATGLSGPPVLWAEDDKAGNNIPGSYIVDTVDDPNPVVPLTFTAFSGYPMSIDVTLEADAIVGITSFAGQAGNASADSDFGHTLLWGGISSVTDSQGDPIPGWTVTSASGFDYSQPAIDPDVPEPSTILLSAIALPTLLRGRGKKRGRS